MGKARKGKTKMILEHLQNHKGITSMEAFQLYGATRLSAIIFELRKEYDIVAIDRMMPDRFGCMCTFSEYRLADKQEE